MTIETKPGTTVVYREANFSDYISYEIEHSNLTQNEISNKMGLNNANLICMYKQQKARVPLIRVPSLARILNLDPGRMLRLAFYEYQPETARVIEKFMGGIFGKNETLLLSYIVKHLNQDVEIPKILTKNQSRKLKAFIDSLNEK